MNNLSNLHPPSNRLLPLLLPFLFLPCLLSGQTAIPLTASSFDHDAVEEAGCASAMSMDASNHAFDGSVGWPVSLNYTFGSNPYVLRPYSGFNAQQVLSSFSATLTLASPTNLANLHFLVTSTEGASTTTYTVNFTDATTQTLMTATTPDWVIGGGVYISDARSIGTCIVKGSGHLFEASGNISPANYGKTVSSITVSRGAGGGRLYIFGVSSCGAGAFFSTCPGNISVSCPGAVNYTASATGATSVSYSFGGATSGSGSGTGSGSSFGFGLTTVTITATNSCGTQTCVFFVAVDDNTPPTALCQNASVSLTQAGTASISATAINNGSFDNCGGSVSLSPAQFNFFCNYGPQTVTLTVMDLSGNSATCTATVTVSDPIGPVFEFCPGNIVVNNDPGQCNARVCYPSPRTYDDNCPPLTPAGYTYFNQNGAGTNNTKYYYFSNTLTNYATATANARAAGGHLAVITSAAEQAHIPPGVRWLGGSDALIEGTFQWETCEPFGYTNWAAGEPNNQSGIEDHMATWTGGFWNDVNVAGPYGSVLEIEGVRFVQTTGLPQNAVFPVGTTTNTFVATDAAGNTASCQFTVTVNDNTPPTITCPGNISVNVTPGLCTAPVGYPAVTGADNCSFTISRTGGLASGSLFPVGVTTNTFVATDASLNTASCQFTVTVSDNQPPTAVCQNITVPLAGASVTITGSQINNGSSDLCGGITLSVIPTTFNCNQVGQNLVALTVTDASGNTAQCFSQVTVVDNTPPVAVCQNIPVALVGASANIIAAQINGGSSDNCSYTLSASPTSFNCSNVGPNTVALTVTDMSGNTATCNATVTVVDNTLPVANCNDNVTVALSGASVTITAAEIDENSSDNCSFSLSVSPSTFDCSDVGANTVTLTVTDASGNTATCFSVVNVVDNTPPNAICQNVTVTLNASGNGSTTAAAVNNGSSDACGIASMSLSQTSFNCANVGSNSVTLTVTDNNGNTAACTATVTVVDNVPPVTICQNVTVYLNASGNGTTTAAAVNNGSSDACGIASLALSQTSFNCSNVGANSVTLTVTDVNGNTSTCTATVNVVDNVPPVAVCQNFTVYLNASGNGTTTAAAVNNGSSDACGIGSLALSQTSFNCSNVGANSVTLTVTDVNGNTATCTATVTVVDNVPPVAVCQNVTVYLNASGNGTTTAAAVNNGSSDACGIASLALSQTSFNCSNVGANSVTLTVTDVNGNTATCTATVTVVDNVPPVAICQNVTVYLNASGNGTTTAAAVNNGSSDACGIASLALSQTSFNCSNVGANSVTLTVTDVNGNSSTCTATVTVVDNIPPVAICKSATAYLNAAGTVTIAPADVFFSGSDNCGTVNLVSVSPNTFTCSNVGANSVTLNVNDGHGNTSICTATVTVVDNLLPTIACPGPITVDNAPGLCSAPVSYTVTASDNCAYTITQTGGLASGQQFPVGTTTNIWKVTDASGNTATCSFTVTVLKIGDPGLLFAYTVIGFDEVKMKTNTVQSGGVGVVNSGKKAKLEHATMVTAANTFVKAPILDLNGGSMVTTYYPGQVSASLLPAFQPNTAPCNNDVNIADNSGPVTLGLACYGKITVGKNVNVTFSGHAVVTAKELNLKEGSAAFFAQSTNLRLDKKLDTDKYVDISNNGHNVWIFAEDHVKIDDGNNVTANIYCQKHIHVDKTPAGNPTYMTGLFIAEKVDSKENVFWNWDPAFCPGAPPPMLVANLDALTFYAEKKGTTTKLQWFTRSGQTNDHFVVERSANQLDWHPILKVDGEGPADELIVFNELDLDPLSGDNFYRLLLVSKDGSERRTDVRKVAFPDGFLAVYPNPNGGDVLFTAMSEFAGQAAHVEISNAIGNVVEMRDFDELPDSEIAWGIAGLTSGTYFISVKIPGKRVIVKRFVVQRL